MAEDVCQDTYVKALRFLSKFAGRCEFKTWLHHIVRTTSFNALRERRRRAECSVGVREDGEEYSLLARLIDPRPLPDAPAPSDWQQKLIAGLVGELTKHEHDVFTLRHIYCMHHREIALCLNTTEGAAKVALHSATRKLRELVRLESLPASAELA